MNKQHNIVDLARELGRAISEMRTFMRQNLQVKIREQNVDITFELLEILGILFRKDGVNQQEIADVIVKDKSSMTYLIDNLEKRGMVERREDQNDRRSKLIYLTEKGRALEKELNPWIREMYEKATMGMEMNDLQVALSQIQKMNENLRKQ
ncbi:DNA-binding transcriptional regulator, MarR family [Chitinophaga terrae (ex Kim and Jung 2007)]|uniref:DNA-binding transcriptional regulator, MarR family n=1 Tax=Chitinophaga terrae (ex Kim and Jung 2007) TaxID=408074 RepID=A0A1H4D1D2_9BACT|nr:MarR family transcriptional regulator [Chitinophaga terrae (ex Kim and Jung 2007)]GEP90622.1 MarR family transcriptional regulator [Chitinophaga terrae (ex Kim and Jung 2007)]SEA66391.1 DNA-binding transcriptional regulator, MarR family [Chitinophaga terrae (ex Kim and Jung 2007)]